MRMRQVIKHRDIRLLNMIRRTDPEIPNRMILRQAMLRHGFKPFDTEWWHFTLKDEPFPDTYFTFPVK